MSTTQTGARCPSCFTAAHQGFSETGCRRCGWRPGADNKPPALPLRSSLHERYRIGQVLGQGGFGITYLAWHDHLRLTVAIKEYLPGQWAARGDDGRRVIERDHAMRDLFAWGRKRFLDEARAVASLDHPAIVGVKDFFEANGTAYIVMEHLRGATLKAHLVEHGGSLPFAETLERLTPVMDALDLCHRRGLLHRDIAPDNIHLTADGGSKLIDFGAARQAVRDRTQLTAVFKRAYAPLEQQAAEGKQGPWTDIYAFAATFYHCLTGAPPPEALDRMQKVPLEPPSRRAPDIPRLAERTLLRALALLPEQRIRDIPTLRRGLGAEAEKHPSQPSKATIYARRFVLYLLVPLLVGLLVNGLYDGVRGLWGPDMDGEPTVDSKAPPGGTNLPPQDKRSRAEARKPTAQPMSQTAGVFGRKVVAGSDQVVAFKTARAREEHYRMKLLRPYVVISETEDYYRITDIPADSVEEALTGRVGYVPKEQTHLWPTREALSFAEAVFMEDRPALVAWDSRRDLERFLQGGGGSWYPPAFQEDVASTLGRERSTRPYPVLDTALSSSRRDDAERVYDILLPVVIPPEEAGILVSEEDVRAVEKALLGTTIVVVFDATSGMGPFAFEMGKAINNALDRLPTEVVEHSEMGFVFFRDVGDDEKLVAIKPIPLAEAASALRDAAALMAGGGDLAEPFLDAVYYAAHVYDWGQHGRRIIIGVLQDDAKPETTGTLDDQGRVPAGLDVNAVLSSMSEQDIPVATVQAGPSFGQNLELVLQPLADKTGGQFLRWESGATANDIGAWLMRAVSTETISSIKKGRRALDAMRFDSAPCCIPMQVRGSERLKRLRREALAFGIDPEAGGILVLPASLPANGSLLIPKIRISKALLQELIHVFRVLSTIGVDPELAHGAALEAISAIAGADIDEQDTIAEIMRKRVGIEFRTELLYLSLEDFYAMPSARRRPLAREFAAAGEALDAYLEENLPDFDSLPEVWMPVSVLP